MYSVCPNYTCCNADRWYDRVIRILSYHKTAKLTDMIGSDPYNVSIIRSSNQTNKDDLISLEILMSFIQD